MFKWLRNLFKPKEPTKELPDYPNCLNCDQNDMVFRDGESSSTAEARYRCFRCNQHFFSGGWCSGI